MSYVLAIEPRQGQASVLRDNLGLGTTRSKLTVVESMDAAITAIDGEVPNLVLLSALTPPDEEDHLIARLRDLPQATAPQVVFVPALAQPEPGQSRCALIDRFLNRNPLPTGNPVAFADQLSAYLRESTPDEPVAILTPTPGAARAERRAAARLERVDWARLLIGGAAVDVVDLSLTGAQIVSSMVLAPGGSIQVMLSSKAGAIQCEAGIVWSVFESTAPSVRAGINFKVADRRVLERLYFEWSQAQGPGRPHAERVELGMSATAPQEVSIVRRAVDRRPRAERWERRDVPWLFSVKLPWGLEARPVNISSTGLLLESGSKVPSGSIAELTLCGPEWQIVIPASVVRSEVALVNGLGVKYHIAAAFEKRLELEFPGPHPISRVTKRAAGRRCRSSCP